MAALRQRIRQVPRAARLLLVAALVAGVVSAALGLRDDENPRPGQDASTVGVAAPDRAPAEGQPDEPSTAEPEETETGMAERTPPRETPGEGAIPAPESTVEPPEPEVAAASTSSRFVMPLREWSHVTDRFGAARGYGFIHGGIDLALEGLEGSTVYASCAGTVSTSEYSRVYGDHVVVDCGEGWATLYAHMSERFVAAGEPVTQEAKLGRTGSSGFSTGEHLHFEIWWQGDRVNPEHYLDFQIPPGTPLSSGPLYWPSGGSGSSAAPPPTSTPTNTPTPTATPTDTPIPTATMPPQATNTPTQVTPTPRPTNTPTPTPPPPTPTNTPTPPAMAR